MLSLNPSRPWRLLPQIHHPNAAISSFVGVRFVHRQVDINIRPPIQSFVLCPSNGLIIRSISMANILLPFNRSYSAWGFHLKEVFDDESGSIDAVFQFKDSDRGDRQGPMVFDLMDSTSVLNLVDNSQLGVPGTAIPDVTVLMAAKAVNWRPMSAMAGQGRLPSAVVGARRRRWPSWAWASPNRMWASSAGMPWLVRASAWANEAFELAALKSDWPDGGISVGWWMKPIEKDLLAASEDRSWRMQRSKKSPARILKTIIEASWLGCILIPGHLRTDI